MVSVPNNEEKLARRLVRGSQPAQARAAGGGRFEKKHRKTGGRRKGVQNHLTRDVKEAIVNAAIRVGADGAGKDGLEGYLMMLARKHPKSYAVLLRGVMPLQVNTSINTLINVQYKSLAEATEEARKLGLPDRLVFELKNYRRIDNDNDGSVGT
jgi:hypothetical protein